MATDLHTACLAELDRREQIARAAAKSSWFVLAHLDGFEGEDARFIEDNTPLDALRRYRADRDRLDDHEPCEPGECVDEHGGTTMCYACDRPAAKCREVPRIARSLGIPTGGAHADH